MNTPNLLKILQIFQVGKTIKTICLLLLYYFQLDRSNLKYITRFNLERTKIHL